MSGIKFESGHGAHYRRGNKVWLKFLHVDSDDEIETVDNAQDMDGCCSVRIKGKTRPVWILQPCRIVRLETAKESGHSFDKDGNTYFKAKALPGYWILALKTWKDYWSAKVQSRHVKLPPHTDDINTGKIRCVEILPRQYPARLIDHSRGLRNEEMQLSHIYKEATIGKLIATVMNRSQ